MPKYDCDMGHPLDMLVEECGEVIQAVMKHKRFEGTNAYINPRTGRTAMQEIHQEIADLQVIIDILISRKIIDPMTLASNRGSKYLRLEELFGYEFGQ